MRSGLVGRTGHSRTPMALDEGENPDATAINAGSEITFLLRRPPFECRQARMPSVRQSALSTWLCASNTARRASISTSSRLRR
jgi:hypothetical protein